MLTEGEAEGLSVEEVGISDGLLEGSTLIDGIIEVILEGPIEGDVEGDVEGTVEGTVEGALLSVGTKLKGSSRPSILSEGDALGKSVFREGALLGEKLGNSDGFVVLKVGASEGGWEGERDGMLPPSIFKKTSVASPFSCCCSRRSASGVEKPLLL